MNPTTNEMRLTFCYICLAVLNLCGPAFAQEDANEQAEAYRTEAIAAFNAGETSKARALFEQEHTLAPSSRTLFHLGRCDIELSSWRKGVEELEAALTHLRKPLTEAQRADAQRFIDIGQRHLGTLTIASAPADASVVLDGVSVSGTKFYLEPGAHVLTIDAPRHRASTSAFTIVEGEHRSLELASIPEEPARAVEVAAPRVPLPEKPVRNDVGGPAAQRVLGIVALSVGGVALATGATFGVVSLVETGDIKQGCPNDQCSPDSEDNRARADLHANVANVLLPVGALALGYGLFELLTLPSTPTPARAGKLRVEPYGLGARAQVRF